MSSTVSRAVTAFPALASRRADFERWLASVAPRSSWGELNLDDLALAWLASKHEPSAVNELDRRLRSVARARLRNDSGTLEEVLQRARERLLVGDRPRLLAYRGRGSLVQYLKAVVATVAIDLSRGAHTREEGADNQTFLNAAAEEAGVDARLAHASWRKHFTQAFTEALATLETEERTWLRMRFVDGLSTDAVGAAFGVHRTTAMRRLEKAQAALLSETRRRLARQMKLDAREVDSLVRGMRLSLAENLSRILPRLPVSS
ncbi:MAG: sigma-70 family RNA polymerase sigma factor [Myxococcaceae bacterium]|nr:sigma-70 family RNA polymerase sigma factor [Myxococcaceae bacterium]